MKEFLKIVILALSALATIGSANAALVAVDYNRSNSGDGWITRDTVTGLDWLDVSLTANKTIDQVRTGIWISRGFRYASKDEVRTLFENAGIPDDGFNVSVTHPAQALALAQLLGPTHITPHGVTVTGFMGTDYFGDEISLESHPIGDIFSAQLAKIDYYELFFPYWRSIGEAHFTGGHPFSNEADTGYGSFLVRSTSEFSYPIPEPGSCSLIGLGLVALTMTRQRRRKHIG